VIVSEETGSSVAPALLRKNFTLLRVHRGLAALMDIPYLLIPAGIAAQKQGILMTLRSLAAASVYHIIEIALNVWESVIDCGGTPWSRRENTADQL
jgi:hypothetical protein